MPSPVIKIYVSHSIHFISFVEGTTYDEKKKQHNYIQNVFHNLN